MARGKTLSPSAILGQQGVNLIERVVLEMRCRWNPTIVNDVGIDGYIELCDRSTGEALGLVLAVQSRATAGQFNRETADSLDYICDQRDLDYWLKGNSPVILVVSRPPDEAYWVSVKTYFTDPAGVRERRVTFDKQHDVFALQAYSRLAEIAAPAGSGLFLGPFPRSETLASNLLEVRYPSHIQVAASTFADPRDVANALGQSPARHAPWVLSEKAVLSFADLTEDPWPRIADRGSVDTFASEEWAVSDDADRLRAFAHLLNQALRADLYPVVRFWKEEGVYAFRAGLDRPTRRIQLDPRGHSRGREVVAPYLAQSDRHLIAYRHMAADLRFLRFDGRWYLQVNPSYLYTTDGVQVSRFTGVGTSALKRLEHNDSVLGQVRFWMAYVRRERGMFTRQEQWLSYDESPEFNLEVGIDDEAWLGHEDAATDGLFDPSEVQS